MLFCKSAVLLPLLLAANLSTRVAVIIDDAAENQPAEEQTLIKGDIDSENEVLEKTEPDFASEEKIDHNFSESSLDNNPNVDEKEEFSAEETESSEIDDEFNQETEEELLDIPTFLRRQAN